MTTYENLAKFPCYGCEYATITNHYIPVFWCVKRHKYVKKCFKKCKDREDGQIKTAYMVHRCTEVFVRNGEFYFKIEGTDGTVFGLTPLVVIPLFP